MVRMFFILRASTMGEGAGTSWRAERFRAVAGFGDDPVEEEPEDTEGIPRPIYETAIEELDLSVRAYNCLKRAG